LLLWLRCLLLATAGHQQTDQANQHNDHQYRPKSSQISPPYFFKTFDSCKIFAYV
jgi:hypothetical protein